MHMEFSFSLDYKVFGGSYTDQGLRLVSFIDVASLLGVQAAVRDGLLDL